MRLLENAKRHKDMPMCIAAVAVAESIIADRCESYLFFKEKEFMVSREKEKGYVETKVMIDKCGKHFKKLSFTIKPKSGNVIEYFVLEKTSSKITLRLIENILANILKPQFGKHDK